MNKFKNLKVGDTVYVVRGRMQTQRSMGRFIDVTYVGRKYGAVQIGPFHTQEFLLSNGQSRDAHNANANGFGFTVYASEDEYLQAHAEFCEVERLKHWLCLGSHRSFPVGMAGKINAILAEYGIL